MSRVAPDWSLIDAITRHVREAPGGGIHRAELAAKFGLPAEGKSMSDALKVAWRQHKIDFCRQYIVVPATRGAAQKGTTP